MTTTTLNRIRVRPRPQPTIRVNARQTGDPESWHCRALLSRAEVARVLGPEDSGPCQGSQEFECWDRYLCPACRAKFDRSGAILNMVADATGWYLSEYGHAPGRAFASAPTIYIHNRHPGVLVVSWSGGLDI